jgi:hypothetical protein
MTLKAQRGTVFSLIPASEPLQVTTTGSAQTLTAPTTPANVLIMQNIATTDAATATNVHYTIGGTTDPSATVGFLLEDGDSEVRWDFLSNKVPVIKVYLSTSAVVQYQWFLGAS